MQRNRERIRELGPILFQLALERRKAIGLISQVDDEFCQGLIPYSYMVFELRAYLQKCVFVKAQKQIGEAKFFNHASKSTTDIWAKLRNGYL